MFKEWSLSEEVASCIKGSEDMPAAWKMLDAVYNDPLTPTKAQAPKLREEESVEESES
jgi:hypothetical protein